MNSESSASQEKEKTNEFQAENIIRDSSKSNDSSSMYETRRKTLNKKHFTKKVNDKILTANESDVLMGNEKGKGTNERSKTFNEAVKLSWKETRNKDQNKFSLRDNYTNNKNRKDSVGTSTIEANSIEDSKKLTGIKNLKNKKKEEEKKSAAVVVVVNDQTKTSKEDEEKNLKIDNEIKPSQGSENIDPKDAVKDAIQQMNLLSMLMKTREESRRKANNNDQSPIVQSKKSPSSSMTTSHLLSLLASLPIYAGSPTQNFAWWCNQVESFCTMFRISLTALEPHLPGRLIQGRALKEYRAIQGRLDATSRDEKLIDKDVSKESETIESSNEANKTKSKKKRRKALSWEIVKKELVVLDNPIIRSAHIHEAIIALRNPPNTTNSLNTSQSLFKREDQIDGLISKFRSLEAQLDPGCVGDRAWLLTQVVPEAREILSKAQITFETIDDVCEYVLKNLHGKKQESTKIPVQDRVWKRGVKKSRRNMKKMD